MTDAYQAATVDRGIQEDGRRLWVFTQSKLKQIDTCPERGRRGMLALMPDYATDSSAMGQGVHLAIELCLTDVIAGQGPWHLTDMIAVACQEFDAIMALPDSRWIKVQRAVTIYGQIARILTTWYERVLPGLQPFAVEVHWGPLTIYEDDVRTIQLEGKIDYIDIVEGLQDWKTASRPWDQLEHQRWDLQPTVYTWLQWRMDGELRYLNNFPWAWHVFQPNGNYQKIETTRSKSDWLWLRDRCLTIAQTLEAELPAWPKNDTHWLCSQKWCGAWDTCKGGITESQPVALLGNQ